MSLAGGKFQQNNLNPQQVTKKHYYQTCQTIQYLVVAEPFSQVQVSQKKSPFATKAFLFGVGSVSGQTTKSVHI